MLKPLTFSRRWNADCALEFWCDGDHVSYWEASAQTAAPLCDTELAKLEVSFVLKNRASIRFMKDLLDSSTHDPTPLQGTSCR